MKQVVRRLDSDSDFETDEYSRNIILTESGLDRIESELGCGSLHASENLALLTGVNLALHAEVLLKRDVDYIVRGSRVELADEFTGRLDSLSAWRTICLYGMGFGNSSRQSIRFQDRMSPSTIP